jgi:formamidopyrimidine-DNA glycosylase
MPELPDVAVYVGRLEAFVGGRVIEGLRVISPSLVKTYDPPVRSLVGKRVRAFRRLGKRIVFELDDDLFAVLHLMIAGRLRWRERPANLTRKRTHAAFDFEHGSLVLTEASTQKRASLHVVRGEEALAAFDRGGLDVYAASTAEFADRMRSERHTLKRSLTDPRLLDAIGNAYSDEILHRARLSPVQLSTNLSDEEMARLHAACRAVLTEWTDRLRDEVGEGFPEKVTAFRPGMAVHGKFGKPCPDCGAKVQRIVYATRETNYCAACQTGGRLLKDRALSRLLREDWPKALDDA